MSDDFYQYASSISHLSSESTLRDKINFAVLDCEKKMGVTTEKLLGVIKQHIAETVPWFQESMKSFSIEDIHKGFDKDGSALSKYKGISEKMICYLPFSFLQHNLFDEDLSIMEKIMASGFLLSPKDEEGNFLRDDQYPGVYMSLREKYEKDVEIKEEIIIVFPLTLLKFSDWFGNYEQAYGDIGMFTFTPKNFPRDMYEHHSLMENNEGAEFIFQSPVNIEECEFIMASESYVGDVRDLCKKYNRKVNVIGSKSLGKYKYVKSLFLDYRTNPKGPQLCYALQDENNYGVEAFYKDITQNPDIEGRGTRLDRRYNLDIEHKPKKDFFVILSNCGYEKEQVDQIMKLSRKEIIEHVRERMDEIYSQKRHENYKVQIEPRAYLPTKEDL